MCARWSYNAHDLWTTFSFDSKGKGGTIRCPPNKLLWRAVKSYFGYWQNWMDMLAIISTVLIIPFRIADSDWQWRFAALAFIFHGLRLFKFAVLWP